MRFFNYLDLVLDCMQVVALHFARKDLSSPLKEAYAEKVSTLGPAQGVQSLPLCVQTHTHRRRETIPNCTLVSEPDVFIPKNVLHRKF